MRWHMGAGGYSSTARAGKWKRRQGGDEEETSACGTAGAGGVSRRLGECRRA
ncbi:MAG: hypothetical protein N2383_13105 [Caldilineales bacterium]|nr:hypothetical protein [Caldilineales bacterium]